MKRAFVTLALAAISMSAFAQQKSGIITYKQTISFENVPAGFPKEQKLEKVLYFNETASLYETLPQKDKPQYNDGSNPVRILQGEGGELQHIIYTDLKTKKIVEQRDFMGRMFLINKDLSQMKWKITGRQKTIIGLPAMEAVSTDEQGSVVAWFTSSIPVSSGPDGFGGLSGMIMEITMGPIHTEVISVAPGDNNVAEKIKMPSKGKKVTNEEFKKIEEEKMNDLQKQYGGSGNVIIIGGPGQN